MWMLSVLVLACIHAVPQPERPPLNEQSVSRVDQEAAPSENQEAASVAAVVQCEGGAAPVIREEFMDYRILQLSECADGAKSILVGAALTGTGWSWRLSGEETEHAFDWVGSDFDRNGYMVLQFWACPYDGCKRASFFQVSTHSKVRRLGEPTNAHEWRIGSTGTLEYLAKVGYNEGYSVASATQAYRLDGVEFIATGPPVGASEIRHWPCQPTVVEAVAPDTGESTGERIPVSRGDSIEVLDVGTKQPLGEVFEYRVNGKRFWARNWTQNCAG